MLSGRRGVGGGRSKFSLELPRSCYCCSVIQSCPTLCDPMDCSTSGFPVHHHLPELAQTHVHWVGDAIQPSCPLLSPSPSALDLSQHQGIFQWVSSSSGDHSTGASASASVLPMNIQDWFPLGLTDLISLQSKGLSWTFPTPHFKSINSSVLCLLYGPTLTFIHDHWKNHRFNHKDLCWQSPWNKCPVVFDIRKSWCEKIMSQ